MDNTKFYDGMMIRNVDCGTLYMMIKDNEKIKEYEQLKRKKSELKGAAVPDKEQIEEIQTKIEKLSQEIHTFADKKITLSDKNNRYRFSGTIADSLMGRKLRQAAKSKNEDGRIKTVGGNDYTDIIINIKFRNDIIIADDTPV
jgi:predicted  nucleic acid-binding Zn-ribbon protein